MLKVQKCFVLIHRFCASNQIVTWLPDCSALSIRDDFCAPRMGCKVATILHVEWQTLWCTSARPLRRDWLRKIQIKKMLGKHYSRTKLVAALAQCCWTWAPCARVFGSLMFESRVALPCMLIVVNILEWYHTVLSRIVWRDSTLQCRAKLLMMMSAHGSVTRLSSIDESKMHARSTHSLRSITSNIISQELL